MKIIVKIYFVYIVSSLISCEKTPTIDHHISSFLAAKVLYEMKEFKKSQIAFSEYIKKYPNSKPIEDSYYFLQSSLAKQNKSKEKRKRNQNLPKGTVVIGLYYSDSQLTILDSTQAELSYNYLDLFPDGKYREHFYNVLLSSSKIKGNYRFLKFLESLKRVQNYELQYFGWFHSGLISHAEQKYAKAIANYYGLIKIIRKESEKSKIHLYISNCYYRNGKYQQAIDELKLVYKIENSDTKKYMSKMADRWMPYYLSAINNNAEIKSELMSFN